MSVETVIAALAPGFERFLISVGILLLASFTLVVIGWRASPTFARRARTINRYVLLAILSLIVLFPIYITVVNSLLPPEKIAARPPTLVPSPVEWSGYSQAWT